MKYKYMTNTEIAVAIDTSIYMTTDEPFSWRMMKKVDGEYYWKREDAYHNVYKHYDTCIRAALDRIGMQDVYEAYEVDPPEAREMDDVSTASSKGFILIHRESMALRFLDPLRSDRRGEYANDLWRERIEYSKSIANQVKKARDNKTRIIAERGYY